MDEHDQDERDRKCFELQRLAPWKRNLLVVSIVMMVAGAALTVYAKVQRGREAPAPVSSPAQADAAGSDAPAESRSSAAPTRGFIDGRARPTSDARANAPASETPSEVTEPQNATTARLETFSPALFKLGFSFFAGFCIAYALRTVLKIALTIIGFAFIAGFALQYFNLVDINWHLLGGRYDSAAQWLSTQFSSFKIFITGQLPSAASATAGLVIGLKR